MNRTDKLYNVLLTLDKINLKHLAERHSKSKVFLNSTDKRLVRKLRNKGLDAFQDTKGNVVISYV